MSIRIGIMGYGNLGRGVECAVAQNPDMELKMCIRDRNRYVRSLSCGSRRRG